MRNRNTMRMSGSRLSADNSPRLRSGTGYLGKYDGLGCARPLASSARAAPLKSYNPTILQSYNPIILQSFPFAAVHYNSHDINVTFKFLFKPVSRADYFCLLIISP